MGRIIDETNLLSELRDADVMLTDNAEEGSGAVTGEVLKAQFEIVGRKGTANGYAGLNASGVVPPEQLAAALVPEEVANDAALAALTVVSGDIGRRIARVVAAGTNAAGTYYIAKATGAGLSKWQVYNSNPAASATSSGVVELATATEAIEGADTVRAITAAVLASWHAASRQSVSVQLYIGLVTVDGGGRSVWSDAVDAALGQGNFIFFPAGVYWLDRPIMLADNQHIIADPNAVIKMTPNRDYCLVQNEDFTSGNSDISVTGGIWETGDGIGNERGGGYGATAMTGQHGVFLFYKSSRLTFRNITVRSSHPFGFHIISCTDFTVNRIYFDGHLRDGVHINGTSSRFHVSELSGSTADDMVALNAFEWDDYTPNDPTPVYGNISNGVIDNVVMSTAMRLLTGNGYSVSNITFRDIRGSGIFKLYEQSDGNASRSTSAGVLYNISFENIAVTPSAPNGIDRALIDIATHIYGLFLRNITLPVTTTANLIAFGPKSQSPSGQEIFYPTRSYVCDFALLEGIRTANTLDGSGNPTYYTGGYLFNAVGISGSGSATVGHLIVSRSNILWNTTAQAGAHIVIADQNAVFDLCELAHVKVRGASEVFYQNVAAVTSRVIEVGCSYADVTTPVARIAGNLRLSSPNLPIDLVNVNAPGAGDYVLNNNAASGTGVGLYIRDAANAAWVKLN